MLGGPSMNSYQASHRQGELCGHRPPMMAHRERENTGSRNGLRTNSVPKIVEGTPQAWLQDVLHTVEGGTRNLGEQFKAIDARAHDWIRRLRPGVGENKRRITRRRAEVQRLGFATISNPFKQAHPQVQAKLEDMKDSAEKVGEELRVPVPEAKVAGIGTVRSLVLKQVLCGILAGAVSSFAIAPFQVLKTRVVAGQGGSSTAEVMQTVAKYEGGMQSLMKGDLLVTILATSVQKGVQFAVYEAVKRKEEQKFGEDKKLIDGVPRKAPISTVAGAVAGLASTLVVYPLQTLMDRLLLQPGTYTGLWESVVKVYEEGGLSELYRGSVPAVMAMVPQVALGFYIYETVSEKMKETKWHPASISLTAGALAGLVSTTLTYPLESARKQISVSAVAAAHFDTTYNNIFQAVGGIVQHDGLGGLYKGFVIEAAQVIPVTAISFLVYELAKRAFVAQREERRDEVKG